MFIKFHALVKENSQIREIMIDAGTIERVEFFSRKDNTEHLVDLFQTGKSGYVRYLLKDNLQTRLIQNQLDGYMRCKNLPPTTSALPCPIVSIPSVWPHPNQWESVPQPQWEPSRWTVTCDTHGLISEGERFIVQDAEPNQNPGYQFSVPQDYSR